MAELQCPKCGESIPDDSRFCDICGTELLECVNCRTLGTPEDQFCPNCGKPMVGRNPERVNTKTETEDDDPHKTGAKVRRPSKKIVLRYQGNSGLKLVVEEAIIGRENGPWQALIKRLPENLVSRTHARFEYKNGKWHIIDLNSKNGCGVNDVLCQPNVPMAFKAGDVVDIATHLFNVTEE